MREADALDCLDVVVERLTRQFQPLRIILGKVVFERDYQPSAEAAERSLVGAAARDVAEG